jgi:hypothetical protein
MATSPSDAATKKPKATAVTRKRIGLRMIFNFIPVGIDNRYPNWIVVAIKKRVAAAHFGIGSLTICATTCCQAHHGRVGPVAD